MFFYVLVVPQDDEDCECGIMASDVDTDHGEGFLCERRGKPIVKNYVDVDIF